MSAALIRNIQCIIVRDLARKMVFVGGPQQVDKTRLGQMIVPDPRAYMNFDVAAHREAILKSELPPTST